MISDKAIWSLTLEKFKTTRRDQSKEQANDDDDSSQTSTSSILMAVFEALEARSDFHALLRFGQMNIELVHAVESALCTRILFNRYVPPAFFGALKHVWLADTVVRALENFLCHFLL